MNTVLVIGGPTASGKSGLALAVAEKKNGTVINADSMQIYAGLPLLTAQPAAEDKARAPHKLYGTLAPTDICSAARWRDLALEEIRSAQKEGRLPIITGGTGFYIKTLLEGISPIPDIPARFREEAAALQKELGHPAFHAALARRDPETAAKLDPFNTQRLVRAWEVLLATGKGLSHWQSLPREGVPSDLRFITVTLLPPRKRLYDGCDIRFVEMIERGTLSEAKAFKQQGVASPLDKALGYPELCAHIDGTLSLPEAVMQAQQSTRNYAKRQVTWFRHQIPADLTLELPDEAAVISLLKN